MDIYVAPGDKREKSAAMLSDGGALDTARQSEPIETERRLSAGASLAIMMALSLALWALIWFCLTCLISFWP